MPIVLFVEFLDCVYGASECSPRLTVIILCNSCRAAWVPFTPAAGERICVSRTKAGWGGNSCTGGELSSRLLFPLQAQLQGQSHASSLLTDWHGVRGCQTACLYSRTFHTPHSWLQCPISSSWNLIVCVKSNTLFFLLLYTVNTWLSSDNFYEFYLQLQYALVKLIAIYPRIVCMQWVSRTSTCYLSDHCRAMGSPGFQCVMRKLGGNLAKPHSLCQTPLHVRSGEWSLQKEGDRCWYWEGGMFACWGDVLGIPDLCTMLFTLDPALCIM